MAVLLNRINELHITIAIDGSLYRFHPKFKKNMEKAMQILVNPHIKVSLLFDFFLIQSDLSKILRT